MSIVANGLKRLNLHQTARKPLKILWLGQLPVQPRGTGFQRVLAAGNKVFHIDQHAKIPAEFGAILMCDARKLLRA